MAAPVSWGTLLLRNPLSLGLPGVAPVNLLGSANFSVENKMVNIFGFSCYEVRVTTIQLCHCSRKIVIGNTKMNTWACVLIKLYLQNQAVDWIWPVGGSLPDLNLERSARSV